MSTRKKLVDAGLIEAETTWETRNLTVDESSALMRKLTLALGHSAAMKALSVIGDMGAGIFMATDS